MLDSRKQVCGISWCSSHGQFHRRFTTQSYMCVPHRRCLAHQQGKCDLRHCSLVQIIGGSVHECREEPFEQSDTHFSAIWPKSMWSSRKILNIVHSIERLHVMMMVDRHICTDRLRIHLNCIRPLMKFGDHF